MVHAANKSICYSTDNKADNCVHNKAWMKIKGHAAASLVDVFFGSSVVVQPQFMVAVSAPQGQPAEAVKLATTSKNASKVIIKGTDGVQKCIKVLRAYRIVLLGETGAGKSTLGNTIFGDDVFKTGRTTEYQLQSKSAHERRITVLDTPGFSHAEQPEVELKGEIARCTTRCTPGPHVFLIVMKVEKSSEQLSAVIDKICQCFPEEAFKYAAVVFTHGEKLPYGMKIEKYINENQCLKDLVIKCSNRYHVVDHKYSPGGDKSDSQVSQLFSIIDNIVIENKGRCYTHEMLQADKREKDNTKSGNPKQSNSDNRANACNKLWINFSGPEGNLVAEVFFGSDVAVWQTTQRSTKIETKEECTSTTRQQGEYKATYSEPKQTTEEKYTMSTSHESPTSMEGEEAVKQGREATTEFDSDKNEASEEVLKAGKQEASKNIGESGADPGKEKEENKTPKAAVKQGGGSDFVGNVLGMVTEGAAAGAEAVLTTSVLGSSATAGLTGVAVEGVGAVISGLTGVAVRSVGEVGAATAAAGAEGVATDAGDTEAEEGAATDVAATAGAEGVATDAGDTEAEEGAATYAAATAEAEGAATDAAATAGAAGAAAILTTSVLGSSATAGLIGVAVGGVGAVISGLTGVAVRSVGEVGAATGAAGAEGVATDAGSTEAAEGAATDAGVEAEVQSATAKAGSEGAAGGESSTGSTGRAMKISAGIGSVAAAAVPGAWLIKKIQQLIRLYKMIKKNIGIILLVVAFYFLLFLSFCDRVPMVGTILLSCGILLMFLVILLLFIAIMK